MYSSHRNPLRNLEKHEWKMEWGTNIRNSVTRSRPPCLSPEGENLTIGTKFSYHDPLYRQRPEPNGESHTSERAYSSGFTPVDPGVIGTNNNDTISETRYCRRSPTLLLPPDPPSYLGNKRDGMSGKKKSETLCQPRPHSLRLTDRKETEN